VKGAFTEHGCMNLKERDFKKGSRDEVSSWLEMLELQEIKLYHGKTQFLPEEKFSRKGTSFVKARP